MPRPISWLSRLHAIQRAVSGSVRSHYGRRELQQLFELQPRAAQNLLDALPTVAVGTSLLVKREALATLLERIAAADDPASELARARDGAAASRSRRKLRELLPHDHRPVGWDEVPASLELAPGRVTLHFTSVEELALTLVDLASLLDHHLDEFAGRYEIHPLIDSAPRQEREKFHVMLQELEHLEAAHKARQASEQS